MIKNILLILALVILIMLVIYMNYQDIIYCEKQIIVSKKECLKSMGF